jgi:hypothetical protein
VGDLYPKAAVPGEIVYQSAPLVELARGRQQEPPSTLEQAAEEAGKSGCRMSRHRRRIGDEIISSSRRRRGFPGPGVVRAPTELVERHRHWGLEMEVFEGRHTVKLSSIAPVDIPRPLTNFSPVSLHLTPDRIAECLILCR